MSRSIKDLRELINISRLSYHGDQEEYLSDELEEECEVNELKSTTKNDSGYKRGKKIEKIHPNTSTCLEGSKESSTAFSTRSQLPSRFKPLPAINSSNTSTIHRQSSTTSNFEKSCYAVLQHIEPAAVRSWLVRANETVHWLSNWISTEGNFVKFAQFWLSDVKKGKQKELVELEVGIVIDEITFAIQKGIQLGQVSQEDVMTFFQVVIWEYPSKLCGEGSCVFSLNTLLTLASGKKEEYRQLLSNVNSATKNPEHIHWILAARSFALISIVSSIVKFYLSLVGSVMECEGSKERFHDLKKNIAFDAVRMGYKNVLAYLVSEQNVDVSQVKSEKNSSLLFTAVTSGHEDIADFIMKVSADIDISQVSESGNSLLHAAVNTGNASLVKSLISAGADVNQVNVDCDGATPLHLAVMQGNTAVVSVLLGAGADINASMKESQASSTPLKLAEDLEMSEIVDMMRRSSIQ